MTPSKGANLPEVPKVPIDCPFPVVLGIDPGTRVLGFGALLAADDGPRLLAAGVLRAPAQWSPSERLGRLHEGVEHIIANLRPRVVAVETAFVAGNVKSALRIGEGRGLVLALAARAGAAVLEYSPASVKKCVVGNGAASKPQVARMVSSLLRTEVSLPDDATDALALALTYLHAQSLSERLGPGASALRHK